MELAINGLRLMGNRYGVGRYIEYMLKYWDDESHPFDKILVYTPGPLNNEVKFHSKIEHRIVPTRWSFSYWEQVVLAKLQRAHDVLFCPSYISPILGKGKTVVTHLGSYEGLPSAFGFWERWRGRLGYQLSALTATRVITVSESSKRDIVRFYRVAPQKVSVIHLGVDPCFRPISESTIKSDVQKRYIGSEQPYILFVGKLSKRRHIPQLIAAFARLKHEQNLPHALFLVGPDIIGQNVHELAKRYGVEKNVIHQEFASHDELIGIYNGADLFVYPSAYEGFGIPVLEAMACGVPTIALHNTSFLEFATGVAHLVQSGKEEDLYSGMKHVLFSTELQTKMRKQGPERARLFGWANIARQTMDVLTEVAKNGN